MDPLRQSCLVALGVVAPLAGCGPTDADNDGFRSDLDCDDSNPNIRPDVAEICDNVDNNCDGIVDEDAIDRATWYADLDGDGFGDADHPILSCASPEGAVGDSTDCSPLDAGVHPMASEHPTDRLDNDCDGMVDEVPCPEAERAKTARQVSLSAGAVPLSFCIEQPAGPVGCPSPNEMDSSALVTAVVGPPEPVLPIPIVTVEARWTVHGGVCGPDEREPELCCYSINVSRTAPTPKAVPQNLNFDGQGIAIVPAELPLVHGRPLVVGGRIRLASASTSTGWLVSAASITETVSGSKRRVAGQQWKEAALHEHASVASFAKFTMDLLALGAPARLVTAATEAQADEVIHAQLCFAVAAELLGEDCGPGPVPLDGLDAGDPTAETMMIETIRDACVNESIAAAEAAYLSAHADHEGLRSVLSTIADDESRHAAMGWQTVQWIVREHPELKSSALNVFSQVRNRQEGRTCDKTENDEWMIGLGCMPRHMRREVEIRVWDQVIEPCIRVLERA